MRILKILLKSINPLVDSCPFYTDDEDNLSSQPPIELTCTRRSVNCEKKVTDSAGTAIMTVLFHLESGKDMKSIRTHILHLSDEEMKLKNSELAMHLYDRFMQRNININLWTSVNDVR